MFKQRIEIFFRLKKINDDDQVSFILLATGDEGMRRFNAWNLSAGDRKNPKTILETFAEQLEPAENFRVCRLKLSRYSQQSDESIDTFVNRCRHLAKKCKFADKDLDSRILELLIASTPFEEFQKDLLNKDENFTLSEAIKLGRTYEATAAHSKQLQNLNANGINQLMHIPSQNRGRSKKRKEYTWEAAKGTHKQ